MYLTAGAIFCVYVLWWLAARKESTDAAREKVLKPFCQMAQFLCKRIYSHRSMLPQEGKVSRDLERLYPNGGRRLRMDYYVRKTGLMLLVLLTGVVFSLLVRIQADMGERLVEEGAVKRGNYRDGGRTLLLEARVEGYGPQKFELSIAETELDRYEAGQLYEEFIELLCSKALNQNESWEEIRTDLNLADRIDGYPFTVSWKSSNPEVISDTGAVLELMEAKGCRVALKAEVTYGDCKWEKQISAQVLPPDLTEEESQEQELRQLLQAAEQTDRTEERFQLPGEWRGRPIIWREYVQENSFLFFLLTLSASAAVYFLSDRDLHEKVERRKNKLREAYPVLVNKLVLYMGAGMTVRGAFMKIGEAYRRDRDTGQSGKKEHPAYEELLYTCHELQAGVSEGAALEHLGRRTGLQEYSRLCTQLAQNLKKGNKALLSRLREEADRAMQDRINLKRQAGEEAATKLLVPMVMMLAVVMVIIMIPAFSSFGI